MSGINRPHIFLSDVHLGGSNMHEEEEEKTTQDLLSLIEYCIQNNAVLYVLGDLFDYWMEYPKKKLVPNFATTVLNAFEEYNNTIQPALFITGNHDNWTFGHFEERGFDVEQEFRLVNIDQQNVLLMHGDGLYQSKGTLKRPWIHRVLRNPTFVSIYQKLFAPKYGVGIMKSFSAITRNRERSSALRLNKNAQDVLKMPNIDIMITGHDHIHRMETFEGGSYINLGAFYENRSIALYNNNGFCLVKWVASTKEFVSFSKTTAAE